MTVEDHVRRGHPITFALLTIFSIIAGAISTWLVVKYDKHEGYPSRSIRDSTRFLTFASWWTLFFAIIYLIFFQVASASPLTSIASHGTWIIITWIFWTAGAASITSYLGGGLNCGRSTISHCHQLNALEAFAWINWVILSFLLVIVIALGIRGVRSGKRFSSELA